MRVSCGARLYSVCDVISESESSAGEVIFSRQEAEIKNMSVEIAIKDIMGRDNDNKETSAIIENSNHGKLLFFYNRTLVTIVLRNIFVWHSHNLSTSTIQQMQESERW